MSQILGYIICDLMGCGSLIPMFFIGMGMVAPLLELCHPQSALEAATQNCAIPVLARPFGLRLRVFEISRRSVAFSD